MKKKKKKKKKKKEKSVKAVKWVIEIYSKNNATLKHKQSFFLILKQVAHRSENCTLKLNK